MVAIRYRNPLRPEEAGIVMLSEQKEAQEARENLIRRGFIIVDDHATPPPAVALPT